MDLSQEKWSSKQKDIKDKIILDVRTPEEFKEKRIPNSILLNINSPVDFIEGLDKFKLFMILIYSSAFFT